MGRDKCLVELDGEPLWRRQMGILSAIADEVCFVAPERPAWCRTGMRWLKDAVPGQGPLGGLVSALENAAHEHVLLLAVDLPAITARFLEGLRTQSSATGGAVPIIDGLYQPLSAIYPRSARTAALARLSGADKSLQPLLRELVAGGKMRGVPVPREDRPLFRNLNTACD